MSNKNLAAIIPKAYERVVVEKRDVPEPGQHEILVQTRAFAANPVDHALQDESIFIPESAYPLVLGSDVCGIVHEIGPNVNRFIPGDRVAGFAAVIYNQKIDHGAAQEWVLLREDATARIPDEMSFEEGSVFPMAWATAGHGLFAVGKIPRPKDSSDKPAKGKGLLVWGGSSSVGSVVIQMAKNLGFTVFTTATSKHHDYLRKLGADFAADYNDGDAVSSLVKAAKDQNVTITYAYNAISVGNETFSKTAEVVAKARGEEPGRLMLTRQWPDELELPEGLSQDQILAFQCWVPNPDLGSWLFNEYLTESLEKKTVVPSPEIQVVPGGINGVQDMWNKLKAGVSGKKLVVKVEE